MAGFHGMHGGAPLCGQGSAALAGLAKKPVKSGAPGQIAAASMPGLPFKS